MDESPALTTDAILSILIKAALHSPSGTRIIDGETYPIDGFHPEREGDQQGEHVKLMYFPEFLAWNPERHRYIEGRVKSAARTLRQHGYEVTEDDGTLLVRKPRKP